MRRGMWLTVAAVLLSGALGAPAVATADQLDVNIDIGRKGDRYIVKGPVDLHAGEVARSVIVLRGPVTVREGATITDDLVVVDGAVLIAGTVRGRVVTLGGRATLTRSAAVGDGIRYGSDEPRIAAGARVSGGVSEVDLSFSDAAPFVPALAWWIAMSVSTLVLGLLLLWLAPRAAEATFTRMRDGGWGPAIGIGFVLVIGLPLLAVGALVTLVGIPFGIGLLLALTPLAGLGYVTGAWVLGRALVGPPHGRFLAYLAGWGILRAIGLIPVAGALGFVVAAMFGIGALSWALWQARRAPGGPEYPLAPSI